MVDDAEVRGPRSCLSLLGKLLRDNWAVVMPDGSLSTVFWGRVDRPLSFLQVGRHVDPDRFGWQYELYRVSYGTSVAKFHRV